ncbi:hypothetical protein GIB67_026213, partial [Kingdonia uniflora]
MSEEEATEVEEDFYCMWRFYYIVLTGEQRWRCLRILVVDKVEEKYALLKLPDREQEKITVPRKLLAILNVHNLKFLQSSTPKTGQEQKTRFLTKMIQGNIWEIPNICGLAQSMVTDCNSNRHPRGLSGNSLTGSLSPDMCQLTGLWYLSLQGNKHSEKIPEVIGLMQALAVLYLQGNSLTGPIPIELGNMTKLSYLLRQTRMRCLRKWLGYLSQMYESIFFRCLLYWVLGLDWMGRELEYEHRFYEELFRKVIVKPAAQKAVVRLIPEEEINLEDVRIVGCELI